MESLQFTPKWSRIARLSLVLATVAGTISTQGQTNNSARYTVTDLGPVGAGQPFAITDNGIVSGEITLADPAVSHAVLWNQGKMKDISSPGLGGPNSAAFGANIWGHGQADTKTPDENGEDFCGSTALALTHSGHTWRRSSGETHHDRAAQIANSSGKKGSNGAAIKINDFGIAAGTAKNAELDSTCRARPYPHKPSSSNQSSGPDPGCGSSHGGRQP